ncbi:uncharacterized protein F5891DRAFT_978432 [Suillus fuscotomentosus]|uniref:Fungal-type protein kinase domain-containing protein n=1 Tax=Suillus fuscotomentosus TaxID=1912939 RepID=A0AAD4EA48_9AGAM|nr:uncharacterized protein F5891DRAFT_978432 [Suillus fuscotomentosus]KAG1902515.1 hypothetical protein F5891DRAFT_978432 [Suillus fuscotomentosus]
MSHKDGCRLGWFLWRLKSCSTPATGSAQTPHEALNELRPLSQLSRGVKRKQGGNNEDRTEEDDPAKPPPIVQNGLYIAEMFMAHIMRQHIISFIVNNNYIYIWFCDRETTIQGTAINFVQDLPCWLVLLLIMQQMGYKSHEHNAYISLPPVRGVHPSLKLKATIVHTCNYQDDALFDSLVDCKIARDTDAAHAQIVKYTIFSWFWTSVRSAIQTMQWLSPTSCGPADATIFQ